MNFFGKIFDKQGSILFIQAANNTLINNFCFLILFFFDMFFYEVKYVDEAIKIFIAVD